MTCPRGEKHITQRFERLGMKVCTQCLQEKSIEAFAWKNKNKNKRQSYCLECQKVYSRKHYQENKQAYLDQNKIRAKKVVDYINKFKSSGCAKCGETHPACLEIHHTDPSLKTITPALIRNRAWTHERIDKEFQSCIVLCSNCHRKEHWNQKHKPA